MRIYHFGYLMLTPMMLPALNNTKQQDFCCVLLLRLVAHDIHHVFKKHLTPILIVVFE